MSQRQGWSRYKKACLCVERLEDRNLPSNSGAKQLLLAALAEASEQSAAMAQPTEDYDDDDIGWGEIKQVDAGSSDGDADDDGHDRAWGGSDGDYDARGGSDGGYDDDKGAKHNSADDDSARIDSIPLDQGLAKGHDQSKHQPVRTMLPEPVRDLSRYWAEQFSEFTDRLIDGIFPPSDDINEPDEPSDDRGDGGRTESDPGDRKPDHNNRNDHSRKVTSKTDAGSGEQRGRVDGDDETTSKTSAKTSAKPARPKPTEVRPVQQDQAADQDSVSPEQDSADVVHSDVLDEAAKNTPADTAFVQEGVPVSESQRQVAEFLAARETSQVAGRADWIQTITVSGSAADGISSISDIIVTEVSVSGSVVSGVLGPVAGAAANFMPQGLDLLTDILPTNAAALDVVIQELVEQVESLGSELQSSLEQLGVSAWMIAAAAAVVSYEVVRRRRRARTATPVASADDTTSHWVTGLPDLSSTEET